MESPGGEPQDNSHCSIVGLLGILIQVSLGVLSFSVLILKRHFEKPKRPWKIWRFDTLKQVISQLLAHFINLTISLALTSEQPDSDTCLWYFITNVFDNTVGVFICVLSLRLVERRLFKTKQYELISGHYYEIKEESHIKYQLEVEKPEAGDHSENTQLSTQTIHINYKAWTIQLLIWNAIVIGAKMLLFALEFLFRVVLDTISKVLLGWIEAYPNLELVVVIVIVPVIMNGFAFWVQDNFLKKREIPPAGAQGVEIELNEQQSNNEEDKSAKDKETNDQVFLEKTPELDMHIDAK